MISIPISVLSTKNEEYISLSTIKEHQNFCKAFLKSYHSYEKKKTEDKGKNKNKFEENFFQTEKKQMQEEIFKWFSNLTEEERIKICTIKNKWLVNLLLQMYLLSSTYDNVYFLPVHEMKTLFEDNKNFSHNEDGSYNNNNTYTNDDSSNLVYDFNFYENFFKLDLPTNINIFNKQEEKKRDMEKEFIDHIKIISLNEDEQVDILTLGREILVDCNKIKKYLNFFSDEKCFQEWLLPIQTNNSIYNFIFPHWMHELENITIFVFLAGYIEQQILLHYEYFFYSKKIYEYSYSNKIVDLYEENKKLVSFVNENYSIFGNSDPNKKEFISRMEIREIVKFIKTDEKKKTKLDYIKNLYSSIWANEKEDKGGILKSKLDQDIYQNLYNEMIFSGVDKVIEHITFTNFLDVTNFREVIFSRIRKNIIDNQCEKVLDELLKDDLLSANSNKNKKKNKKKKKKNKNNEDNEDSSNKNKKGNENKEEEKKEEKNVDKNIIDKKDEKDNPYIKEEIKEFKIEENKKEIKSINLNNNDDANINCQSQKKIDIKKNNDFEEDLKQIKLEKNSDTNEKIKENDLFTLPKEEKTNYLFNQNDVKEDENNINLFSEEDISSKKSKNKEKEIFLYPTNTTKKKNKKKKKPCLSAKKILEKKNNNNDKNIYNREQISGKNSPSYKIQNEKSINIFINTSDKLFSKKENNDKEGNNLNLAKSPAPFFSQHESFSFNKDFVLSDNKSYDNSELSDNDTNNINNINNTKLQPKNISNNINISNESNTKSITIEKIKTNNTSNNYSQNTTNNTNFINYINIPVMPNVYTSYTPSEKFFESLSSEIKAYNSITLNNISNLNPIKNKYLDEMENLIKSKLESKYEIKYGHYGSHFTNLSIEGSDIDILIYYKNKKDNNSKDFFQDILATLNQHEDKFISIQPILTASVPVIKLQIDIKNEIKDLKLEHMSYLEGYWEFDKINFDLTFTQNEQEYLHSQQIVDYINKSINTYPIINYLLLLLKRYFKIMKMNKSFHGGLSSYSLYLLILSFCKKFPTVITSKGKALYSLLGIFSFFEFDKFGVDVENEKIFYALNNNININNYNTDDNIPKKEINLIDPLTKLNVAKSSFKVDEIQTTFRTAYDFLRTEGCYYDYAVFVHKTGYDNDFFKQIKNNYDIFDTSDFKIIKKMFTLNKNQFFCDFFAN